MLVGVENNKGGLLGGKNISSKFTEDVVAVDFPAVSGFVYALLGVDGEEIVAGFCVRTVGAARLEEADFETRVCWHSIIRAWDFVALEDFTSAYCFGVHEAISCV